MRLARCEPDGIKHTDTLTLTQIYLTAKAYTYIHEQEPGVEDKPRGWTQSPHANTQIIFCFLFLVGFFGGGLPAADNARGSEGQ